MTLQELIADIDYLCSTTDSTYPLADKVRNVNFSVSRIVNKIMQADGRWKYGSDNATTLAIAEFAVEAGTRDYPLEPKHSKVLRLRMGGLTLIPFDRHNADDDLLNATGTPTHYEKQGQSVLLYPMPDEGGTLELEYQTGGSDDYFTTGDTSKSPGFNPDFHRLLSLDASRDYCLINLPERVATIDTMIARKEADLEEYYRDRDIDHEPEFDTKRYSRANHLML